MKTKLTVIAFALSLGNNDYQSLKDSDALHSAFRKADDEGKSAMRLDFFTSYLMGNLKIGKAEAVKVLSKERDARNKVQQAAYYRANSKFGYHIARIKATAPKPKKGVWKQIAMDVSSINSIKAKLTPANRVKFHAALAALVKTWEAKVEKVEA